MSQSRQPRRTSKTSGEFAEKSRGVRLQRILADAGVAARRECEDLIRTGAVTVNGKVVDVLPAWADPVGDRIEVYGRPIRAAERHVYVMLFKPRGAVCTNSDPEGRPRAIDLVQHPSRARLYCVGRLDLDSSGLILLTNDGAFANRLTHPRYLVEKGYDLTIDGSLDERAVAALERELLGPRIRTETGTDVMRSSLRLVNRDRGKSVVHLNLCEHRNIEIRALLIELGHPVNKMRRTRFGPLRLKGLAVGEWRDLTPKEVEQLMRAARSENPDAARTPRAPRRSLEELAEARVERQARAEREALEAQAARDAEDARDERTTNTERGARPEQARVDRPGGPGRPQKPLAGASRGASKSSREPYKRARDTTGRETTRRDSNTSANTRGPRSGKSAANGSRQRAEEPRSETRARKASPRASDARAQNPRFPEARSSGPRSSDSRSSGPRSSGPRSSGPRSSGPRSSGPRSSGPRSSGPQSRRSR
jgi:23S rRNA pseudouridine2605 synthase